LCRDGPEGLLREKFWTKHIGGNVTSEHKVSKVYRRNGGKVLHNLNLSTIEINQFSFSSHFSPWKKPLVPTGQEVEWAVEPNLKYC
jgi:hypothetical protein